MTKSYLLIMVSALFITACNKELNTNQTDDLVCPNQKPYCGTDQTGQSIPAEFRDQLTQQRTTSLQSLTVFLDFDGEVIRPGSASTESTTFSSLTRVNRFCPPPVLTPSEIEEVIRLLEDDFSPFNIAFTDDRTVFGAAPANQRMICVFTTIPSVMGFSGFITGIAPFLFNGFIITNQPCFVFCTTITDFYSSDREIGIIASTASQEIAHLIGLEHQHVFDANCSPVAEYHPGFGTGPLGFAPIMGETDQRMSTWWGQPCQSQNDFNAINNTVELKADDFPDSPGDWTEVQGGFKGTLGHPGDVDFIFIRPLTPTAIQVTADNIDLQVSYCAPGGAVIATYNDPGDTHVTIPRLAGLGFLKIEAASNVNLQSQFMTGNYVVTYLDK